MARPKLSSPDQPWPVRIALQVYEALASLKLAVLVIAASAAVLGWATLVESWYGTKAVHFGIYGTTWFAALNVLLGLNVLCAALIRIPWKRYQTGFVITHAGIMVLLIGTLLTRLGGIDAQLPVFEGTSGHLAFKDTQHFELAVYDARSDAGKSPGEPAVRNASQSSGGDLANQAAPDRKIEIPFAAGPFNWQDYTKLSWFPWRLSHRDRGALYDQDGIKLEVLDYLSNSSYAASGPLKLHVKAAGAKPDDKAASPQWQAIELGVRDMASPHASGGRMGMGSREEVAGGQRIVFWVAGSRAETEAFLNSRPKAPLGPQGIVVLYAQGQKYELPVDDLQPGAPVPLGDTGLQVELTGLESRFLGAVLRIGRPGEPDARMVLFGDVPEFNQQDEEHMVFGSYWVDAAKLAEAMPAESVEPKMFEAARHPRVDILQGADGTLYCRPWSPPQVGEVKELPMKGSLTVLEAAGSPVTLAVDEFTPSDKPGRRVVPVPFRKGDGGMQTRQARIRLTVDGHEEESWLEGLPQDPLGQRPQSDQRLVVVGNGRRVVLTLPWDQIDVGFGLYLHEFERKLDPGTSQASWYSSLVDLVDRDNPKKILEEKVLITLNEPVNFSDPHTGRSYRVYQEAFRGPFKPGDQVFDAMVAGKSQRSELFLSWLTFNYDPGRGLKYFGSLLIVAGIGTMFYMRAYFFRRKEHGAEDGH